MNIPLVFVCARVYLISLAHVVKMGVSVSNYQSKVFAWCVVACVA